MSVFKHTLAVYILSHSWPANMEKVPRTLLLLCISLILLPLITTAIPMESSSRVKRQDAPNGCDPATGVGGFLIFPLLRAWCEEQGATDFGVYGK